MNSKKFAIASVASFVFIFISDMLVHGYLLMSTYAATPSLWRLEADMSFVAMAIAQILLVLALTYLFTQKMSRDTKCGGVENGIAVGLPMAIAAGTSYVFMPISAMLACAWFLTTLVQVVVVAKISNMLYKD